MNASGAETSLATSLEGARDGGVRIRSGSVNGDNLNTSCGHLTAWQQGCCPLSHNPSIEPRVRSLCHPCTQR